MLNYFRTYRTLYGLMAVLLLASSILPLVRYVCPMTGQIAVLATLADHHPCEEEGGLDVILCPNGHVSDACAGGDDCCCQRDLLNDEQAARTSGNDHLTNSVLTAGIVWAPSQQPDFFSDSHQTSRYKEGYHRGPSVPLHVLFSSYLI